MMESPMGTISEGGKFNMALEPSVYRMYVWILTIVLIGCSLFAGTGAYAETEKLVVATREIPPFVIRQENGALSGIAIDLWRGIASDLGVEYEFKETDLSGMLEGVRDGSFDLAVAALTVTPEREALVDFSHPFHTSGLGIAVPYDPSGLIISSEVLSLKFFKALGTLLLILLLVGLIIWLLERRANPGQFGGKTHQGIGSGFWWSAVTMTTVGYGDKAPITPVGRLLAIIWMFFSVITISGFTAAIASVFTVQQLSSQISGPNDLPGLTVGTIRGTTSADYLAANFISTKEFPDIHEILGAVAEGRIDATVYDAPVLRYFASNRLQGTVDILPGVFQRQDYAIALRPDSPLREELNRALLRRITQPKWEETLARYLGH